MPSPTRPVRRTVLAILGVTLAVIVACAGPEGIVIRAGAADAMPQTFRLGCDGGERLAVALAAAGALLLGRRQTALPPEGPHARRIAASSGHPTTAPEA